MRSYEFVATDATYEALRRLRAPWAGYTIARDALRVRLEDGTVVRVDVLGTTLEADFEAWRIEASLDAASEPAGEPADAAATPEAVAGRERAFAAGRNEIVIFRGETWIEAPGEAVPAGLPAGSVLQFSGRPGQHSETAAAVCTTTDAVLVASTSGTGLLVQLGLVPYDVQVTEDRETIGRFLAQRGYAEG